MITKMNKFTFLIYYKEYETFLEQLRDLGVVHVEIRQSGELDETVSPLLRRYASYKSLLKEMTLTAAACTDADVERHTNTPIAEVQATYQSYGDRLQAQVSALSALEKDLKTMEPWGAFEWAKIAALRANGWFVQFFSCPERSYNSEWETDYNAILINKREGQCLFLTVNSTEAKIGLDEIRLPHKDYAVLAEEKQRLTEAIEAIRKETARYCVEEAASVERAMATLQDEIDLVKVRLGGEKTAAGSLVLLEGWAPEENSPAVEAMLEQQGVYYETRAAEKEDNAPIKLHNNKLTRSFEMLTKMYGMPDYGEFDPTPMLAPFYALFFGLCLGDAGYGLFLVLFGLYLKKKVNPSMHGVMNLLITLGAAATVVGALVGTFFGVELVKLDLPQGLKDMMIVGKWDGLAYDKTMVFALIVGMFHICFAMTVKGICSTARYGFKHSLSAWGWWLFICGSVVLGTLYYLDKLTLDAAKPIWLVIAGISAVGIYLLNNIRRNVFVNVGAGLWDTYNMATGLLGDLLSYLRLYALGLAGGMLGGVFNSLGMQARDSLSDVLWGIPGWIVFGLIFVFGHSLNIALSCLSAYVHSIRLTFVEYFKNSGYDGRGVPYQPFSSIINQKK